MRRDRLYVLYSGPFPTPRKTIPERAGLVHSFGFRKGKLENREENVPFQEALKSPGELAVSGNILTA